MSVFHRISSWLNKREKHGPTMNGYGMSFESNLRDSLFLLRRTKKYHKILISAPDFHSGNLQLCHYYYGYCKAFRYIKRGMLNRAKHAFHLGKIKFENKKPFQKFKSYHSFDDCHRE